MPYVIPDSVQQALAQSFVHFVQCSPDPTGIPPVRALGRSASGLVIGFNQRQERLLDTCPSSALLADEWRTDEMCARPSVYMNCLRRHNP